MRVGVGWKGQVGLVIGKGMKDNGKDVIVKAISIFLFFNLYQYLTFTIL